MEQDLPPVPPNETEVPRWKIYSVIYWKYLRSIESISSLLFIQKLGEPIIKERLEEVKSDYAKHFKHTFEFAHRLQTQHKDANSEILASAGGDVLNAKFNRYCHAIEASAIVLTHTTLESLLKDLFEFSALYLPERWEGLIQSRVVKTEITLSEAKVLNYSRELSKMIAKEVTRADGLSLPAKIDRIFELCKTASKTDVMEGYSYDRDRIKEIDKLRINIVHGDIFNVSMSNPISDLEYLKSTGVYLYCLLGRELGISGVTECPTELRW